MSKHLWKLIKLKYISLLVPLGLSNWKCPYNKVVYSSPGCMVYEAKAITVSMLRLMCVIKPHLSTVCLGRHMSPTKIFVCD